MKRLTYILPLMYIFVVLQGILLSPVFANMLSEDDSSTACSVSLETQNIKAATYLIVADDDDDQEDKRRLHLLVAKRIRKAIAVYQNHYVCHYSAFISPAVMFFCSDASPPLFV